MVQIALGRLYHSALLYKTFILCCTTADDSTKLVLAVFSILRADENLPTQNIMLYVNPPVMIYK